MSTAYQTLELAFKQIASIEGAASILHWDAATMLPQGSSDVRADQLAALAEIAHAKITAPSVADLLANAHASAEHLSPWQQANLREMTHRYAHANALPESLVSALTRARLKSEHCWRQAKEQNDYAMFAAPFSEVLHLSREAASAKASALNLSPYDALLDSYDAGLRIAHITPLFDDLKQWLPTMVDEVIEHQSTRAPLPLTDSIPLAAQEALGRTLMEKLGFDFNKGRIDTSVHPFCGGVPGDVRLTTRYREDRFTDSLYGVLHETGHALYEMGLPTAWRNQPVGEARGMSVHESQSLLIEMQLALSAPFLQFLTPLLHQAFGVSGAAWSAQNLLAHLTQIERSFIRVSADELTYPLHIMLRTELEQALLSGDLLIADLPDAWNDSFEKLLHIRPKTLADGCLQDIHWPEGMFGYFPTYSLGAMLAAQLFSCFKLTQPDWSDACARGNFAPLISWLHEHIHAQGSFYKTPELILAATGAPLSTAAYKAHLKARYLS